MPVFAGLNWQLAETGKNRINRQLTYNIQANITNVTHNGINSINTTVDESFNILLSRQVLKQKCAFFTCIFF